MSCLPLSHNRRRHPNCGQIHAIQASKHQRKAAIPKPQDLSDGLQEADTHSRHPSYNIHRASFQCSFAPGVCSLRMASEVVLFQLKERKKRFGGLGEVPRGFTVRDLSIKERKKERSWPDLQPVFCLQTCRTDLRSSICSFFLVLQFETKCMKESTKMRTFAP